MRKVSAAAGFVAGLMLTAGFASLAFAEPSALQTAASQAEAQAKATNKQADGEGKLNDRVVRIMLSFAWGLVPEEYAEADGKTVKVDKSDPNKFFIPTEDARRVIRAGTRSAQAQICQLQDKQEANYAALMKSEAGKKTWSKDQMLFIHSLHLFTVLYLTGNAKLEEKDDTPTAQEGDAAGKLRGSAAPEGATQPSPESAEKAERAKPDVAAKTPPAEDVEAKKKRAEQAKKELEANKPTCSQEQRDRVLHAIDTFVKAPNKS